MVRLPFQRLLEGEEIRLSRPGILLGIVCCTVGWLVFVFTLVAPESWLDQTENPILRRMVATAGVIVFALGAWKEVRPWWRQRRLLLGKGCLQLLEGDRVLGQIPYDNIANAVVGNVGPVVSLLLTLHDYNRSDTCWDIPPGFHDYFQRTKGFDLFIKGFEVSPEILRGKILSYCQDACRAARGAVGDGHGCPMR